MIGKAFITLALSVSVAAAEVPTIVALGDSLTAGYGLNDGEGFVPQLQNWLTAQGAQAQVLNAGVSGDTSAGGLARLDWALTPETDALIVTLGGNDLLRGLDPATTRANLEAILTKAQARGLPVLLIGLPGPANFGPDWKAQFDGIFPDLAAKYATLLEPNFLSGLGSSDPAAVQALMQGDGIHPNAEGVQRIVAQIGPRVIDLLAQTGG